MLSWYKLSDSGWAVKEGEGSISTKKMQSSKDRANRQFRSAAPKRNMVSFGILGPYYPAPSDNQRMRDWIVIPLRHGRFRPQASTKRMSQAPSRLRSRPALQTRLQASPQSWSYSAHFFKLPGITKPPGEPGGNRPVPIFFGASRPEGGPRGGKMSYKCHHFQVNTRIMQYNCSRLSYNLRGDNKAQNFPTCPLTVPIPSVIILYGVCVR